jgi:DNA-binding MarR family transcriptional regulator
VDLPQLERALAAFAVLSPVSLPLHHAQVFLVVAKRGQCSYSEIEEELSITNGTVSRCVHAMGETHRKGYPGHGLLEAFRDPAEGRRFLVRLTARGRALARQIEGL